VRGIKIRISLHYSFYQFKKKRNFEEENY